MKKKTYITYYRKNKEDMYKNQNILSYLTKLFVLDKAKYYESFALGPWFELKLVQK